jgi:hypothetical protein
MLEDHKKKLYPNCEDGNTKLGTTLELLQWKVICLKRVNFHFESKHKGLYELFGNQFMKNILYQGYMSYSLEIKCLKVPYQKIIN